MSEISSFTAFQRRYMFLRGIIEKNIAVTKNYKTTISSVKSRITNILMLQL